MENHTKSLIVIFSLVFIYKIIFLNSSIINKGIMILDFNNWRNYRQIDLSYIVALQLEKVLLLSKWKARVGRHLINMVH